MKSYKVRATLVDNGSWHLEVPEVGRSTQARHVKEIDTMARDLIQIMTGEPAESLALNVELVLPGEAADHWRRAQELREQAERLQTEAAKESRETARFLKSQGLSLRDIGAVLGISFQRAHQLCA